jgi:5-methyltetrahydropteroyltriglutamate--homocysteine methyltransferase
MASDNPRKQLLTTVVGSYPVPDWLKALPNDETAMDAVVIALNAQIAAGIDLVCDGEISRWDLRRNAPGGMVERFVSVMEGVRGDPSAEQRRAFHARPGAAYRADPAAVVVGPLAGGRLDLAREARRVRHLSRHPLKFTLTSPYMMGKLVADEHYGNVRDVILALSEVLAAQVREVECESIQIDEPNLPGSPDDGPLAAEAMNRVLDAAGKAREKAVHLCFGNYGGQMIQRGDYGRLVEFLSALHCDHLVLETTRRPTEELERLRDVRRPIRFAVGVIDVKDLQVESADVVAKRIEKLANLLGAERLAYVCPDCGMRMLPRAVADAKMRALVAGRDLFAGVQR